MELEVVTLSAVSNEGVPALTVETALDLMRVADDEFHSPLLEVAGDRPLYGGQLVAQALRAASLTVAPDRVAQSVHAYFLLPAVPREELVFSVRRERDSRRYAWRRVTASQAGEAIFTLLCVFSMPKPGPEYQAVAMPVVSPPSELSTYPLGTRRSDVTRLLDLDIRYFEDPEPWHGGPLQLWVRVGGPLPDDDNLHACGVAFLSDMSNGLSTAPQAGPDSRLLSLDHAVWLHRRCRADEWLFLDLQPHTTFGGRGLYSGRFFDQAGNLVASLVQESLFDNPTAGW